MLTGIFDTHTHYDETCFAGKLDGVLQKQRENGVSLIINCGSNLPSSERSVNLAKKYSQIYAAVGVYPLETSNLPEQWLSVIEKLCSEEKVVAVGEIGLDYFNPDSDKAAQKKAFRAQLELADRLGLPVEIHDRDADEDMLEIVKEYRPKGVIHRFFSKADYGREFLKLGLYLGVGCAITYPDAGHLVEIVKEMPLDRLLLETDCPFLAPAHMSEEIATSDMIAFAAEKIAEVRGDVTAQQVIDIARENGKMLFSIKES